MGSPATEGGRFSDEGPVRTVTIGKRIAMGRYEVSFAEYDRFATATNRERPSDVNWGRGPRPLINVRQVEARAYTTWLSAQTGKTYRLPSEAEWEYAARAGVTTAYAFGDTITCDQANYARIAGRSCNIARNASLARTVAVGSFAANAFGLYDMQGNVWEWVEDCYHDSYEGAPTDGSAWTSDCSFSTPFVVLRGGGWSSVSRLLRSAQRNAGSPTRTRDVNAGFRLVQELNP